jgi:unsaturated rhamnogalacturonyl hydrolase
MPWSPQFSRVMELADSSVKRMDPARMKWMWGQGLLTYSLLQLDELLNDNRYLPFVRAYCERFIPHPPRVDQSDTCAPALSTWGVYRKTGNTALREITERVVRYMKSEPRIFEDAVNHLGHSPEGRFYPKSVWVDSLMMFGVFAARYASERGDAGFLDFAARQPALYARLLQSPERGLFSHSYRTGRGTAYPRHGLFWARGNGWVVASLPMLLGFLPQNHPARAGIVNILHRVSMALLALQRPDGYWETVLDRPGKTYRESSATALIAGGWLRSVREGWLDDGFLDPAMKAFKALVSDLGSGQAPPRMREISAPTIPMPVFPYLGYALVPRGTNLTYGLAALFFAAAEYERIFRRRET